MDEKEEEEDVDGLSFEDSDDNLIEDIEDETDFRLFVESDIADIYNTYVKFSDLNISSLLQFESKPIVLLNEEERDSINNCVDDKLIRLLVLNRAHYSQVRELMKQLQNILTLCNRYIAKGKETVEEFKMVRQLNPNSMYRCDIWKTAAPYFKDAQFYGAPVNQDVIKKQRNGELCLLVVNEGRRWTNSDKRSLLKSMKTQYFDYLYNNLRKTLTTKKSYIKSIAGKEKMEMQLEINRLNKDINELKPTFPPLNVISEIDWDSISAVVLKGRHPAIECIGFWTMVLHPELNTQKWTAAEETKLQQIIEHHNGQDWESIVEELDTHRSQFTAAKHYFSNFALKYNKERFTPEEDKYIMEVVENLRLGSYIPWGKVSYYIDNRSKHQLYYRYKYYLAYQNIKKGQFTEAEDAMLIFLVEKYGKHYNKVVKHFPNRTPVQLRNRYSNYLNKADVRVGTYTYEDDVKILEHVEKFGIKNWSNVAADVKRTRAHVRQRYLTLMHWISKNPNTDITQMARRNSKVIVKNFSTKSKRTEEIVKYLHACENIPKLETLEHKFTPKEKSTHKQPYKQVFTGTDKALINFFKGTCRFQRTPRTSNENTQIESAKRIIKLMEVFDEDAANLKQGDEDDDFLNLNMSNILTYIKHILENEPVSSHFSGSANEKQVKYLIPPTICTLLALRGLIIKFHLYKNEYNLNHNSKQKISTHLTSQLQKNLLRYNSQSQKNIKDARNLFFNRFFSIFKWPIMLSYQFPTHIRNSDNNENQSKLNTTGMDKEDKAITKKYSAKAKFSKVTNEVDASATNRIGSKIIRTSNSKSLKNIKSLNKKSNENQTNLCSLGSRPSTSTFLVDTDESVCKPITCTKPTINVKAGLNKKLVKCLPNVKQKLSTDKCDFDKWPSFDDDFKDVDMFKGIEVSEAIEEKVMQDIEMYRSMMEGHGVDEINIKQLHHNLGKFD